jgi:hypothetical protein
VVAVSNAQVLEQVRELADEELDRPELGATVRQMRRVAVPDLVVEDDRAATTRKIRSGSDR